MAEDASRPVKSADRRHQLQWEDLRHLNATVVPTPNLLSWLSAVPFPAAWPFIGVLKHLAGRCPTKLIAAAAEAAAASHRAL